MKISVWCWIVAAAALGAARPAAAAEQVNLAVPALSFSFTMEYVAQDMGFFAKEGVAVKELNIAGMGSINSLIAGSTDFALASGASLTRAAARGQRLFAVAALSQKPFTQVVMRKEVAAASGFNPEAPLAQRARSLKGHVIAVDGINTVNHAYLRLIAQAGGIDPDSLRVAVVAAPSLPAAFEAGRIDGFAMTPPWPETVLVKGDAALIASGPDGDPANLSTMNATVLLTRDAVCEQRKGLCEKMGHAYLEASQIIHNHPDEALAVLKKRFPKLDVKTIEAAFAVLRKVTPPRPAPTLAGIKSNETFNVMAGLLKPSEALKSFDGLYTDKYVK